MVPEIVRKYLKNGLAATPVVLKSLCAGITMEELDSQPDPDRFTLREAMAHVADWDPIWRERLTRVRTEENPSLPNRDEEQMAIDNDYAHSDFEAQLARFTEDRAALVALLTDLGDSEWARIATREPYPPITLYDLLVLILAHDAYHLRQFAEFRTPA